MLIDTHCHLEKGEYPDLENIIKRMNGIMIASSYNIKTTKEVIELINKYDNIYGTIGIHPTEYQDMNDESLNFIEECLKNKKIVGIGEIGLDYHYDKEHLNIQKEYFIRQINLAKKYNKPIVIHSRDALFDTLEILKQYKPKKFDMHCYGYSIEQVKQFKTLGAKFGIGGVLTFKNNVKLKEVVNVLNMDDILLETDSPYLTPEPFRGEKNEPSYVLYVAQKIATLKNMSTDQVIEITMNNACQFFDLHLD